MINIPIFDQNFDFAPKFRFLINIPIFPKISIFNQYFDFCPIFRFLPNISIFAQYFDFCPIFRFLSFFCNLGITLGKGGFAKVFLAHEEDHLTLRKRTVAIKVQLLWLYFWDFFQQIIWLGCAQKTTSASWSRRKNIEGDRYSVWYETSEYCQNVFKLARFENVLHGSRVLRNWKCFKLSETICQIGKRIFILLCSFYFIHFYFFYLLFFTFFFLFFVLFFCFFVYFLFCFLFFLYFCFVCNFHFVFILFLLLFIFIFSFLQF